MAKTVFIAAAFPFLATSAVFAESMYVYFGTYTSGGNGKGGIYRSVFDLQSGKLSAAVLAAEANNPSFLEIHPNGKFLYAVREEGTIGSVRAYAIDRDTGNLNFLNQESSGGAAPCYLTIDHKGKNLFVANYGNGTALVFPIRSDGLLGKCTCTVQHKGHSVNAKRQETAHAHSVKVSPDDRFVFVADLGIDKIMIYKLDSENGILTANDPPFVKLKAGDGPRHFIFHPVGIYAYVINELSCTITSFAYESASGTLKEIDTITTLPKGYEKPNTGSEICVHPSGKFLYGSNRGHDSIAAYRIDPDKGTPAFIGHETADIKKPRNFNIDPTGRFCLVANQDSNSVVVFHIDQETGKLEPTGGKISVPKPVCVRFLPKAE